MKIYLEKVDIQSEEEPEPWEDTVEDNYYLPMWFFSTPIEDGIELDVPFDYSDLQRIHVVRIIYGNESSSGNCHFLFFRTRREALEVFKEIQDLEQEYEWFDDKKYEFEYVDIMSVILEMT